MEQRNEELHTVRAALEQERGRVAVLSNEVESTKQLLTEIPGLRSECKALSVALGDAREQVKAQNEALTNLRNELQVLIATTLSMRWRLVKAFDVLAMRMF